MSNLKKLETTIRTALPELMDNIPSSPYYNVNIITGDNGELQLKTIDKFFASVDLEPVTILHLLRWLNAAHENTSVYSLWSNGVLAPINDDIMPWYAFKLDLSKPILRDQAPEVIDELTKLL